MSYGGSINWENLAMTNGGGCGGVDGVYNCRVNDGVKVRDDGVALWEDVIEDGEEKSYFWYWK